MFCRVSEKTPQREFYEIQNGGNMLRDVILITFLLLLFGCVPAMNKCIIAPPKEYRGDVSTAQAVGLELTGFANESAHGNVESKFKLKAEQTFYTIPDKLIGCNMLLQTVACLSQRNDTGPAISKLFDYIRNEKLCIQSAPTVFTEAVPSAATSKDLSSSQQALVRHNGFLEIVVLDSAKKPQTIRKSWISCASDDNKQLMQHLHTSKLLVQINECAKVSLNFQIDGSTLDRWLVDAEQNQTTGRPLIQAGYSIIVNGTTLSEKDIKLEGQHANYVVDLLRN